MAAILKTELARAKIRRWRNVHSGWMVIEPDQVAIYQNKLFGGPQKVTQFDTDRLIGVELDDARNSIKLTFHGSEGEAEDELFALQSKTQTEAVNSTLKDLLKELEEQKKREEEEAERLEREHQLHLKQTRELFANEIWETSEVLWLICKADYAMVRAVIEANWSEARQQYSKIWQEGDRLKKISQIELIAALKELDEAVTSQNGQEIIQRASHLTKQLSGQLLHSETNWTRWQNEKEMLAAVLPNYNHLPYFLLFSLSYFEVLFAAQIEDWASVKTIFPLIESCSTILQSCFSLALDGSLPGVNSAVTERNLVSLLKAVQPIECAVDSIFKARPFKFEPSSDQPKG